MPEDVGSPLRREPDDGSLVIVQQNHGFGRQLLIIAINPPAGAWVSFWHGSGRKHIRQRTNGPAGIFIAGVRVHP